MNEPRKSELESPEWERHAPSRRLRLFDGVCLIVGIVIGAGMYESTPLIAGSTAGWWNGLWGGGASTGSAAAAVLAIWLLGGAAALLGALCYAELATAYPRSGGDYVYLTEAYGPWAGFFFAWCEFWVIRPGNIGAMAFVFARYAERLLGPLLPDWGWALAAVLLLAGVNWLGFQAGRWTQNLLTVGKIAGLLLVIGAACTWRSPEAEGSPALPAEGSLYLAAVLVMFTYGGWKDMSYVAAEVREPEKNLLRALLLGTGAITLLYLGFNGGAILALGLPGVAASGAVAVEILPPWLGSAGGGIVSALVCLTTLGAINGMLFTGTRVAYAAGREHRLLRRLGGWSARGAPLEALLLQTGVTVLLIVLLGTRGESFGRLVVFSAPVFFLLLLLVAVAVFRLRGREGEAGRFRAPLHPLPALLFLASTAFMLYAATSYALAHFALEALLLGTILALGACAWWLETRGPPR